MTETGACFRQIDTDIDANEEDIHNAAYWLDKLKKCFIEAEKDMAVSRSSRTGIFGKFGDAIQTIGNDLESACDSAEDDLADVIDVIRSWADQVKWRKDDMADCRDEAIDGGLVVNDMIIECPVEVQPAGDLPRGATREQKKEWQKRKDAYQDYLDKAELFNDLEAEVKDVRQELTDWVSEHMVISSDKSVWETLSTSLYNLAMGLQQNAGVASTKFMIYGSYSNHLYHLASDAATAGAIERARKASKNPATRAGAKAPNQESVDRRIRASIGDELWSIEQKAVRAATAGELVLTFVLAANDIANGKSESQTLLETGSGMISGAITEKALAGIATIPLGVPTMAAVGVSAAVSWGVGCLYENFVPLEVREWVDEGIDDMCDFLVGGAESVWEGIFG